MKYELKITDDAGNVQQYDVSGLLPTDYELESWLMLDCGGTSPESGQIRSDMRRGAKWMRRTILERLKGNNR